jgi:hypothetical protein
MGGTPTADLSTTLRFGRDDISVWSREEKQVLLRHDIKKQRRRAFSLTQPLLTLTPDLF